MKHNHRFFVLIFLFTISLPLFAQKITIQNERFLLNNKPFEMWGIRVASASQSDSLTHHLVSMLDDYKKYGVNTINVYIQGSSGGFSDPFSKNGKKIDPAHVNRLHKIIEECAKREMVVIAGIFYQRVIHNVNDSRNLRNRKSIINATRAFTKVLADFDNVIINIANEQNSFFYQEFEAFNFNDPQNIIQLCELVKKTDADRIVGAGGYTDSLNVIIGRSDHVDVLLFDTSSKDIEENQDSGWHYDYYQKMGVTGKPMVNVEIFGGWTKQFMPPGVYPEEAKKLHIQEITAAKKRPGLSVHFHSNTWCQGPSVGHKVRYHLGGKGTKDDPGIRWWFEAIPDKSLRKK